MEPGVQAVIYGLPLVMMDLTVKRSTNVKRPLGIAAPVNQFAHAPIFPQRRSRTLFAPTSIPSTRRPFSICRPSHWSCRFPIRAAPWDRGILTKAKASAGWTEAIGPMLLDDVRLRVPPERAAEI